MNEDLKYNITAKIISCLHIGTEKDKKLVRGIDFKYNSDAREIEYYETNKNITLLHAFEETSKWIENETEMPLGLFVKTGSKQIAFNPESEIYPCIKSNGKPYIPGSSIKGAMITVLWNSFRKGQNNSEISNRQLDNELGNKDDKNFLGRFIQISDSSLLGEFSYIRSKTFNPSIADNHLPEARWKYARKRNSNENKFEKSGFVHTFECLTSPQTAIFNFKIKSSIVKFLEESGQNNYLPKHQEVINNYFESKFCKAANEYARDFLEREKSYFENCFNKSKYKDLKTKEAVYSAIDGLLEKVEIYNKSKNKCLVRLGLGTGFHYLTGDLLFNADHFDKKAVEKAIEKAKQKRFERQRKIAPVFYKSRKLFFRNTSEDLKFYFPGFIELTFEKIKTE